MTKAPSLALRVIGFLVAAQIPAFLIAWIASLGLGLASDVGFEASLDELAVFRVTKLAIESIVLHRDGRACIEITPELQTEMQSFPGLRIAVFDFERGMPLAGSSPDLVLALEGLERTRPVHMHFSMPNETKGKYAGHLSLQSTPFGEMQVAVYGYKFRLGDIPYSFEWDLHWMTAYLLAAIITVAGTAWLAMRCGLAPLRSVTGKAASIEMNSLHQRLPIGGVPAEIAPLVDAMNGVLARLDASVMRMRRYTANAAHELRTPLAILRARLENIEDSPFRGDLLRDGSRLQAIVEQMLIAARLNEDQAGLEQEVDLVKTIRQIVSGYLALAIECHRLIEFEATESPVFTRGNQRAIECVVANLIDNALRAEPMGGTVLIRVGENAVVAVIDHGEGVAPADREMIFEPFWRKSEATPGTGLGLAISKELMDKLQGRIWVEETHGGGATFKLAFQQSRR